MTLKQESKINIKMNTMDQLKSLIQWKNYMIGYMTTRKQSLDLAMQVNKKKHHKPCCQLKKELRTDDLWLQENLSKSNWIYRLRLQKKKEKESGKWMKKQNKWVLKLSKWWLNCKRYENKRMNIGMMMYSERTMKKICSMIKKNTQHKGS